MSASIAKSAADAEARKRGAYVAAIITIIEKIRGLDARLQGMAKVLTPGEWDQVCNVCDAQDDLLADAVTTARPIEGPLSDEIRYELDPAFPGSLRQVTAASPS
jgi:hypothetical protein